MEADASRAVAINKPTFDEEFITQFGQLSELWNSQHKDYTNKSKRQKGYCTLLRIYQKYKPYATVDDVRKKINSLRSNYRRELRKVAETQKNGDDYTPKSKSFKLLSFLYDSEIPDGFEQNPQTEEVIIKYEEETDSLQHSTSPNGTTYSEYNSMSPTPKVINNDQCQPAYMTPVPESHIYQRTYKETAAWSLANIWSQKLEQIEPMQRLFAEKAINDVLFEAQLGNLHRHSVKINECNEQSNKNTV